MNPKYKTIWMVEDDPAQADSIQHFLSLQAENVIRLQTEMEFNDQLQKVIDGKAPHETPDLIISDVMLPWHFAGEFNIDDVPEQVKTGTYRRAGNRCWSRFSKLPQFKRVPWVFFTILEKDAIDFDRYRDGRTRHVTKELGLPDLWKSVEEVGEVAEEWAESEKDVTDSLLDTEDAKKTLLEALAEDWKTATLWRIPVL